MHKNSDEEKHQMETILKQVKDPELLSQIKKVVPFHGFLTSGALIGIQMLNIARRELDVREGERIYVTCETKSCMPDPFQILAGATIGNNGLKIMNFGKMAVTVNKQAPEGANSIKGIRIILDPEKTKDYPKLHAWFLNTEKLPHVEVLPILLAAGDKVIPGNLWTSMFRFEGRRGYSAVKIAVKCLFNMTTSCCAAVAQNNVER
uniref:Molybdenum formylmethanofuran dehydrogenase subunit fmdE n=1 Tax=Methanosarcina barkeri TaxID=2208 RepID=Q48940_METBA|nr:molybdenum formylmethanofuran dehydrogenase subunit fmdE [Methanosarcina barkeri]prf//2206350D formylmethanofuran dehydrogenase [Methanosarcina barkeri]